MPEKRYYHAYDDRYRQIHGLNLQWFAETPSAIIAETMRDFGISKQHRLLEIGCGEGRDAFPLLRAGFRLLASDVSLAAITFCRDRMPDYQDNFCVLDCITDYLPEKFDFIYAVAVVHMLVPDSDRDAFYRFIYEHLTDNGVGLICSMGDGVSVRQTDINSAFEIQDRVHEASGTPVSVVSTSCRMVDFQTFNAEIQRNYLESIRQGITAIEPDFPQMMYSVVKKSV